MKMEPIQTEEGERAMSEQSGQEAPPQVSVGEKPLHSKFLSHAVIVATVATILAVSTVLAFVRSKSTGSSAPNTTNTTVTSESKQSTTDAAPTSAMNMVRLDERQLQRFQLATVSMK